MWFKRKPNTHALALWTLVMVCGFLLVVTGLYIAAFIRLEKGGSTVYPSRTPETQLPTLFGKVSSIAADGSLTVESKQPFTTVLLDEMTTVTSPGGAPFNRADLNSGATITATGKDMGGGRMLAEALAVIENGAKKTASLLQPPSDWKAWATMPALIGWGVEDGKYAFALRAYDFKAPAVSVELYGWDGKIKERLELDVPGYIQVKPLNDFLAPQSAESRLVQVGISSAAQDACFADGFWVGCDTPDKTYELSIGNDKNSMDIMSAGRSVTLKKKVN